MIRILIILSCLIISISVMLLLMANNKIKKMTLNKLDNKLKSTKQGRYYKKIDLKLNKLGVKFMFKNITPATFLISKVAICLLVFIFVYCKYGITIASISFIATYFGIDIILKISNNQDNEELLRDLKSAYRSLKIQSKAGVYITDALSECYLVVKDKRLKVALLDLNNSIGRDYDIEESIKEFNSKFDNSYIDTFCIVILQSIKSGQISKILDNLTKQIEDIERILNKKEADKLEFKFELQLVLMFIGLIGLLLFGVSKQLSTDMLGVF